MVSLSCMFHLIKKTQKIPVLSGAWLPAAPGLRQPREGVGLVRVLICGFRSAEEVVALQAHLGSSCRRS